MYGPLRDCWERPICSVPGEVMTVMLRKSTDNKKTFQVTGERVECVNLGTIYINTYICDLSVCAS